MTETCLRSEYWDTPVVAVPDAVPVEIPIRVNRSYPVIDARSGVTPSVRRRPLQWTRIKGPHRHGLEQGAFGFVKYPLIHAHEVDRWNDGRSVYLDDTGVYLAQQRAVDWPIFWTYRFGSASFHPWGEWTPGEDGGDVASLIPSWPLVDPTYRTALALGLGPEYIQSNTIVEPARATDVKNPDPGGTARGLPAPEGTPMGTRMVLTHDSAAQAHYAIDRSVTRGDITEVEAFTIWALIDDAREYGAIVMNTTTHGGTIIAPHITPTGADILAAALSTSTWTKAARRLTDEAKAA